MTNQSKGGWAGAQQTSQQTDARGGESPWGLLGLLNVIQMSSADLNTMALGTDLTTLGLNLNSTGTLISAAAIPSPLLLLSASAAVSTGTLLSAAAIPLPLLLCLHK